jgi:hypothetical protein
MNKHKLTGNSKKLKRYEIGQGIGQMVKGNAADGVSVLSFAEVVSI